MLVTIGEKRKPKQLTTEDLLKIRKKLCLSSIKTTELLT